MTCTSQYQHLCFQVLPRTDSARLNVSRRVSSMVKSYVMMTDRVFLHGMSWEDVVNIPAAVTWGFLRRTMTKIDGDMNHWVSGGGLGKIDVAL